MIGPLRQSLRLSAAVAAISRGGVRWRPADAKSSAASSSEHPWVRAIWRQLWSTRVKPTKLKPTRSLSMIWGGSQDHEKGERRQSWAREDRHSDGNEKTYKIERLSPSSIAAYKQCPKLFYYKYILKLKQPPTRETMKGVVVHDVLRRYFDLEPHERDIEHIRKVFQEVVTEIVASEKQHPKHGYMTLFDSRTAERDWAIECLDLLYNFIVVESQAEKADRQHDPVEREYRILQTFNVPAVGDRADTGGAEDLGTAKLSILGILDRLDRRPDGTLRVVDYKTGKVPVLKYNEATNRRIMDDTFDQLKIYALLVREALGETPAEMRIIYLQEAKSVTRKVGTGDLDTLQKELHSIWRELLGALGAGKDGLPVKPGKLCGWCFFRDRCPAFST